MGIFRYLMFKRFKNTIKSALKSPSKIITAVLILAALVMVIFSAQFADASYFRDINELYAAIYAFYYIMFLITLTSGLKNGASFFSMSDVNLLFPAPIKPLRILIYGLVRQLGTTLLMAFFILFQYSWLASTYGVVPLDVVAILLGYALSIFCGQLLAIVIYSYSSGSEKRQRTLKTIIYAVTAALLIAWVLPTMTATDKLSALVARVNEPLFSFFPVVGWLKAFAVGLMEGAALNIITGLAATALFTAAFIFVLSKTNADFYEDVLLATEISFSAIAAKKEGRQAEAVPRNVKVGKTGIGKGRGASVFFYKHLLESRRSRIFILDTVSLIFVAVTIFFSLMLKEVGMMGVFFFSAYMMVFASFLGRWVKELTQPYVYMMPGNAFYKLIMMCAESILKSVVESVLIFVIVGIIMQASPLLILACIVARSGFAFMFIAANILTERLFGSHPGKMVQLFFYFLVLIITALPGIIIAVILTGRFSPAIGLLALFGWNTLVSALILYLCRNILNYAELNNQ